MTLEEYKKRLQNHDWLYAYSDDPNVYERGRYEQETLEYLAKENPEFKQAFNKEKRDFFSKIKH